MNPYTQLPKKDVIFFKMILLLKFSPTTNLSESLIRRKIVLANFYCLEILFLMSYDSLKMSGFVLRITISSPESSFLRPSKAAPELFTDVDNL